MKHINKILALLTLVSLFCIGGSMEADAAVPSINSRFITSSNVGTNSATITWINGNGTGRIVVLYTSDVTKDDVTAKIDNGTLYTANTNFTDATGASTVLISDGSKRAVVAYVGVGLGRTVEVTGLAADATYNVLVCEYKNDGGIDPEYKKDGGVRNPASFTTDATGLPEMPTELATNDVTDNSAVATWTAGANATGCYIDLFNYGSQQAEWENVDIGNVTSFTIEALDADLTYGYRLQSYDGNGNVSDKTAYKVFTTLEDETAPTITAAEYVSANTFKLYFSEIVTAYGLVDEIISVSYTKKDGTTAAVPFLESFNVDDDSGVFALCTLGNTYSLDDVKNGTNVTITYTAGDNTYIQDAKENKLASPTEVLLTDWQAPTVTSVVRVVPDDEGYTTDGAIKYVNTENNGVVYLQVTFDELVKVDATNFSIYSVEGNSETFNATIGEVTPLDADVSLEGFAKTYAVQCTVNVAASDDEFGVKVNTTPVARDAYGNVFASATPTSEDNQTYIVDLTAPDPNDVTISKVAIGASSGDATTILTADNKTEEYYNSAAQTDEKTLYFRYYINNTSNDASLDNGKAYLEYRRTSSVANDHSPIGNEWIKVAGNSGDMMPILLPLGEKAEAKEYELTNGTNLYEVLQGENVNGDLFEFRLLPIDIAGNEATSEDMLEAPISTETIVLDNVAPKLNKAYATHLDNYYKQTFDGQCGTGEPDPTDDRYYINNASVNNPEGVTYSAYEFEPDPTMVGHKAYTSIEKFDGEDWTSLIVGLDNATEIYGSMTETDDFVTPNYPTDVPTTIRYESGYSIAAVKNILNANTIGSTTDLRFKVRLVDVAGNEIIFYPTETGDVDPLDAANAIKFRYLPTAIADPTLSFGDEPESCYNIGKTLHMYFTSAGFGDYTEVVAESTKVNNIQPQVCLITTPVETCNEHSLTAYVSDGKLHIEYTIGEGDDNIADDAVIPFTIKVRDVAGNILEFSNTSLNIAAQDCPIINTNIYAGTPTEVAPYDEADAQTKFLYGPHKDGFIVNNNTSYISLTLPGDFDESNVSKIRIYAKISNDDLLGGAYDPDEFGTYFEFDATEVAEGKLQVPISVLSGNGGIADGSGPTMNWEYATENVNLVLGYKYVTDACDVETNIACHTTYLATIPIDLVAPKIVTYKDVRDITGEGFQDFASDYTFHLDNASDDDWSLHSFAEDYGYNIFSNDPIFVKLTYDPDEDKLNFNSSGVAVMPSSLGVTSSNSLGYGVMMSEPIYFVGYNYEEGDEPDYDIEDFISGDGVITITDGGENVYTHTGSKIGKAHNHYDGDGQNPAPNLTMYGFFGNGFDGNGQVEFVIDFDKIVDAAGNTISNPTQPATKYPITLDNTAPEVTSVAVYTSAEKEEDSRLSSTCFNITADTKLYFDIQISELNGMFLQNLDKFGKYDVNYNEETVTKEDDELSSPLPLVLPLKEVGGDILGYFMVGVGPDDYTEDGIFVDIDFANLGVNEPSGRIVTYYPAEGKPELSEIHAKVQFGVGYEFDELDELDNYSYYAISLTDLAFNYPTEPTFDEESYTMDNVAPVLGALTSNKLDEEADGHYTASGCFTATGSNTDKNTLVLAVSVNEKQLEGSDCDNPFLSSDAWEVKIGEETVDPLDYVVTDNLQCFDCISPDNNIKTYFIVINLKDAYHGPNEGAYTFQTESGSYTYAVNVADAVGNAGVSFDNSTESYVVGITGGSMIFIDNSKPTLSNIVSPEGCFTGESEVTFKVTITDNSFESECSNGVDDLDVKFTYPDNSAKDITFLSASVVPDEVENVYNVTVTLPAEVESATYGINVTFTDAFGNTETASSSDEGGVHIIGETYVASLNSTTATACSNEDNITFGYTTNFDAIDVTVIVGETALATGDYSVNTSAKTVSVKVSALSNEDVVTLNFTSACGDVESNNSLTVTINPAPEVTISNSAEGTVCPNTDVTFSITKDAGVTYTWSYSTDEATWNPVVEGDNFAYNDDETELTVSGITGSYQVKVVAENDETECSTSDVSSVTVAAPVTITSVTGADTYPTRGTSVVYTIATQDNATADQYIWSYSGTGVTFAAETTTVKTNTLTFANNAQSGKISVIPVTTSCGNGTKFDTGFLQLVAESSTNISFNTVKKNSMVVTWNNGKADGKILLGVAGSLSLLNKTFTDYEAFSTQLNTLLDSKTASGDFTVAGAISTDYLRSSGSGNADIKFVLDDNDNSAQDQSITNLNKQTRYSFRLFDYVMVDGKRFYNPTLIANSKSTLARESENGMSKDGDFMSLIAPNPAKENVTFSLDLVDTKPVTIEIFSAEGRKVISFKQGEIMSAGEHLINIPLGDLAAGSYSIIVSFGDEFILDHFVVMP